MPVDALEGRPGLAMIDVCHIETESELSQSKAKSDYLPSVTLLQLCVGHGGLCCTGKRSDYCHGAICNQSPPVHGEEAAVA